MVHCGIWDWCIVGFLQVHWVNHGSCNSVLSIGTKPSPQRMLNCCQLKQWEEIVTAALLGLKNTIFSILVKVVIQCTSIFVSFRKANELINLTWQKSKSEFTSIGIYMYNYRHANKTFKMSDWFKKIQRHVFYRTCKCAGTTISHIIDFHEENHIYFHEDNHVKNMLLHLNISVHFKQRADRYQLMMT